jgi:hypothetical protein
VGNIGRDEDAVVIDGYLLDNIGAVNGERIDLFCRRTLDGEAVYRCVIGVCDGKVFSIPRDSTRRFNAQGQRYLLELAGIPWEFDQRTGTAIYE